MKVMKILVFTPVEKVGREWMEPLVARGVPVLYTPDPDEAWRMLQLHGRSIDLAVIAREGVEGKKSEPGLDLVTRFKKDEMHSDLPYILVTRDWSDADSASHQNTPLGANGYLKEPFKPSELVEMIEAVLQQKLDSPTHTSLQLSKSSVTFPQIPSPSAGKEKGRGTASVDLLPLEQSQSSIPKLSPTLTKIPPPPKTLTSIQPPPPPPTHTQHIEVPPQMEKSFATMAKKTQKSLSPAVLEDGSALFTSSESEGSSKIVLEAPSVTHTGSQEVQVKPVEEKSPSLSLGSSTISGIEISASSIPTPQNEEPQKPKNISENASDEEIANEEVANREAVKRMPYLFSEKVTPPPVPLVNLGVPVGDAVVPGGAYQSPDLETLKKYLTLREKDVSVLSAQLHTVRSQSHTLEEKVMEQYAKVAELENSKQEYQKKIEGFEKEKVKNESLLKAEIGELKFQLRSKADRAEVLENRIKDATDEVERLKDRVRSDIRKIRVREKELENRLEILKKDSEVLLSTRENKIVELKRKLDLVEFNLDLMQDRYQKETEYSNDLKDRLRKASRAMKVAGGLLKEEDDHDSNDINKAS